MPEFDALNFIHNSNRYKGELGSAKLPVRIIKAACIIYYTSSPGLVEAIRVHR